jgi:hypothetical protein
MMFLQMKFGREIPFIDAGAGIGLRGILGNGWEVNKSKSKSPHNEQRVVWGTLGF